MVKTLNSVKDQSYQRFAHSVKILDYDQHNVLLLSVETGYDSQFTSAWSKSTIKVYNTELGGSDFETYLPSALQKIYTMMQMRLLPPY